MARPVELLIGAGPFDATGRAALRRPRQRLIAVDGGADHCLAAGVTPDVIVGDLDSIRSLPFWQQQPGCEIRRVTEQETTDFEKALACCNPAAVQLGFGLLEGRFDQSLAALHALSVYPHLTLLLAGQQDVLRLLSPGQHRLDSQPGERLSLFPLTACHFAGSTGLRYPLAGLELALGQRIGTSNEACAPQVRFDLRSGQCLLLRPLGCLWPWLDALVSAD